MLISLHPRRPLTVTRLRLFVMFMLILIFGLIDPLLDSLVHLSPSGHVHYAIQSRRIDGIGLTVNTIA